MLPDALIIGTQRGGTTSCFNYLVQHPWVLPAFRKEVHFFDRNTNWERGVGWYRAHFDRRVRAERIAQQYGGRVVALEETPGYMFRPEAVERMAAVVPGARLLVLLRNPIERAHSNYKNALRKGLVATEFDSLVTRTRPAAGSSTFWASTRSTSTRESRTIRLREALR